MGVYVVTKEGGGEGGAIKAEGRGVGVLVKGGRERYAERGMQKEVRRERY